MNLNIMKIIPLESGLRPNSRETLKHEKHSTSLCSKSQKVFPNMPDNDLVQDIKQELKIDYDNSLLQKPPMELFNKLSLRSDIEDNKISQPKKHLSNKVNLTALWWEYCC